MIGAATTAWYVYGVVPAGAPVPDAAGAARLVVQGPLAAIVAEVPLADFDEEALVERLNDRVWLEDKARAHEDVLSAFAAVTTVVPLRFGTVYRDEDDVRRLLEERAESFEATLDRVRGRFELGVKVWIDRARFQQALAVGDSHASGGGGRAYLQRRQSELAAARDASARAAELARTAHERLRARAVEGVVNRPQPRELTGRDEDMLLNAAYLVEGDAAPFVDEVERLAAEAAALGVTFEVTGPWPPYNFADEGDGAP